MALSRRMLVEGLGLGAVAALAGCRASAPSTASPPSNMPIPVTPTPGGVGLGSPTPTTGAVLPPAQAWQARPSEVNPQVKARATQLLQLTGTWSDGGAGTAAAAADRLRAAGHDPTLLADLDFLIPPGGAAVANITDAQYGGILDESASVLVLVAQWYRTADGQVVRQGRTFDVRLRAAKPDWLVTAVNPAAPGPATDQLSKLATTTLSNSRIRLPDSARADVMAGQIHDSVLGALDTLSRKHVLDVSVLRSGHPLLVFGTDRPSDHPHGRAADVWAIDSAPVVDPANRDLVVAFMREAAATGPWQVGGPVDLDGAEHQYFSDDTHHDHVHLGFHT